MMMIKAPTEMVNSVVEGLKSQPLALPLVVVNLLALGLVAYLLWVVADRTSARDSLISELAKNCQISPKSESK